MTSFHQLEARIGIRFKNPALLTEAFSHKTYSKERNTQSYERLEFLGDSLLNFIVGDYLYSHCEEEEGALTKMRADLVCESALKEAAEALDLGSFLLMGEELKKDEKFNIHSDDLYESLLGAIYCDEDRFEATVYVLGRAVATGRGRNRKTAESAAAAEALRKMDHGEA